MPVIEDAAQAIGARIGSRQAGTMGDVGCFSFFPSKNLGAFGDGGLVTTNDAALAAEMRLLRNHGAEPKYFHSRIGGNFRLDALQAAVLRVKAPHLAGWTSGRRTNAERYRALFHEFGLHTVVELPVEPAGYTHIYNQFVIRVPDRDALRDAPGGATACRRRSTTRCRFIGRPALPTCPARPGSFPVADRAAASSLALPIYGELTADQLAPRRRVSIADFYRGEMKQLVLVTGAAGQLGEAMAAQLGARHEVVALDRAALNLADADAAARLGRPPSVPDVIINCAAYTDVDGAERDPSAALAANAWAVRTLARAALEINATLVHFSTDFVFDGASERPYTEEDAPNPRGAYASSKLLGEWFAARSRRTTCCASRACSAARRARSSVDKMLRQPASRAGGPRVRAIAPCRRAMSTMSSPRRWRCWNSKAPPGVYHCVNTGWTTWADWRASSRSSSDRPDARSWTSRWPTPACSRPARNSPRSRTRSLPRRASRCRPGRTRSGDTSTTCNSQLTTDNSACLSGDKFCGRFMRFRSHVNGSCSVAVVRC